MRYIYRDDTHVYIKCNHCKKVHAYDKSEYEEMIDKKCAECGKGFHFVWWYPARLSTVKSYTPLLIMTILTFLILFITVSSTFRKYYFFNKSITALNPTITSILIPILCSLITLIPSFFLDNHQERMMDKLKKNSIQIVIIVIEFLVLIIILSIVIGTQYCSLQIKDTDTDEIQQYFGNTIDKSASGKGCLFDNQGNLIYIGGFKSNMYDGYGKKYEKIDNLHNTEVVETYQCVYEGEFKKGLPEGKGCEYKYDQEYDFEKEKGISPYLYYDGEFVNGQYCGNGTLYDINEKYNGGFFNGKYNGYGKQWVKDSETDLLYKLEAVFADGKANGPGKKYYTNGKILFDGEYKEGKKISGKSYYKNGNLEYEGTLYGDNYIGEGKLYWENGNMWYDGFWNNGKREKNGVSYREDGTLEYEGNWKDGKWEGKGKWYWESEEIYYDGDFENGLIHGKGTAYYKNGKKWYEGEWREGKHSGQGIEYDSEGNILHKGEFIDGKFIDDIKTEN